MTHALGKEAHGSSRIRLKFGNTEMLEKRVRDEWNTENSQMTSTNEEEPIQHTMCRPAWGPTIRVPGWMKDGSTTKGDDDVNNNKKVVNLGGQLN